MRMSAGSLSDFGSIIVETDMCTWGGLKGEETSITLISQPHKFSGLWKTQSILAPHLTWPRLAFVGTYRENKQT